jgi:hypothetical protein
VLAQGTSGARVFALCVIPFVILATLNSGGYRYGASDQAFYIPAIVEQMDPALFPRDDAVLGAQTKLTFIDELLASLVGATGATLPAVSAVLYGLALLLFALGAWMIGRRLYASPWTSVALLAALTLRHAIARSGTNTLEGYFHPRTLVYALGALAIAFFLRGSLRTVTALLAIGVAIHPTTAVWFGLWLAVAAAIAEPALRKPIGALAAVGAIVAIWAVLSGPLAGRLMIMDDQWRALLASKDYLFPLQWPLYAWVINLGYLPLIAVLHRRRVAAGFADPQERALVLGSSVLLVIFAGALVCHAIGIALSFQLQPARVFWMFDFLAVVHAVWWLSEGHFLKAEATTVPTASVPVASGFSRKNESGFSRKKAPPPIIVAATLAVLSLTRGVYVLYEAERPAVQLTIADDDWGRVMAWARRTDKGSGWLADPMHAVRYGSSVRVAGERDVFVEAVKDAALGMYDRTIAVRTDERIRALESFSTLTADRAVRLGANYDMDFLVTEQQFDLPLAFESGVLRVYRLR